MPAARAVELATSGGMRIPGTYHIYIYIIYILYIYIYVHIIDIDIYIYIRVVLNSGSVVDV